MTVTTTRLGQAAGISAAVAGLIFIAVQVNHPAMGVASVTTTDWVVRSAAKVVMSVLALAGITGVYLRQHRRSGVLGLAAYLLFSLGYFVMFGVEFLAAFVFPTIADTSPGYVNDVIVAAAGGSPSGDIGLMQWVLLATAAGYAGGGLLFGIATYRAGVLARWAAVLLAAGTVSTLALAVLPESFNRPLAVPTGIALIGLGASLWRDQRRQSASTETTAGLATGTTTAAAAAPREQALVR